eukprot:6160899-Prymnesium_polylepis.1
MRRHTGSSSWPRFSSRSSVIWRCCFGQQCISMDKTTGSSDVTNAHSLSALATSWNASTVQKV